MPGGKRVVTQVSEISGIDPDTKQLIVTDIYNYRDGQTLHPTVTCRQFVESLIQKKLLELRFLYGGEAEPSANATSRRRAGALARRMG